MGIVAFMQMDFHMGAKFQQVFHKNIFPLKLTDINYLQEKMLWITYAGIIRLRRGSPLPPPEARRHAHRHGCRGCLDKSEA